MKKFICILLLLFLLITAASAEEEKPIVTVLDFNTDGISRSEMSSIISLLSSSLFKTGLFTVINISQRQTVLNELEFSMTGCTDESCMLEAGKLLSAEGIILGSIGRVGSRIILSTKMLETETAKTLSTADGVYDDLDSLIDGIDRITAELSSPYGTSEAAVTRDNTGSSISIPGIATLTGGLGLMGAGAYFLAVSLPLIIEYNSLQAAYTSAVDAAAAAAAYDDLLIAWQAAEDGSANLNFILGAALAGAGAISTIVSIVFFTTFEPAEEQDGIRLTLSPGPQGTSLSFEISY